MRPIDVDVTDENKLKMHDSFIQVHTHTHTHIRAQAIVYEYMVFSDVLCIHSESTGRDFRWGTWLPTLQHTMAGVGFVATETISFLATFTSSVADSKITSNDGIPRVEGEESQQSVGRGFCSVRKHTGKIENDDEVNKSDSYSAAV